ncbi:hypothetical protein [Bifidobacterium sp.]|uniref:hypothetical protein n=1 Tax=Bifidobacterium sp. TaxID=41200 RepID=UPI003870D3CB
MHGSQVPTYRWCGDWTRTEGRLAAAMADTYGMPPHPWQRLILDDWLAVGDDGRLLNSLCVLPVPRQNGKTGVCDPRETWGLVRRGEAILHTAQEYQTAKKAFDRLREKFGERRNDPNARFPELNAMVARYTTSANQMVLDLTNGAHIEFRTRGANSDMGRGGTFDLVVIDEAQSYTDEQDAALSPLNSAAPKGSPQTILMGTVPDPRRAYKGEKFSSIREGLHSEPYVGACIHEWGAPEVGDVMDVSRWYEFNPSLGFQLLEPALMKDARTMAPDAFAREHLGWWSPVLPGVVHPISATDWRACATSEPPQTGDVTYAVKFSPDGTEGAICVCTVTDGALPHVEMVDVKPLSRGLRWFCDFLADVSGFAAAVVVDGKGVAQALVDRLAEAGVDTDVVRMPTAGDMMTACSAFVDATRERALTHYDQTELNDSACGCGRRRIGAAGGFGFQSTESADATPAEAAALAYWCATSIRRNPPTELRIG